MKKLICNCFVLVFFIIGLNCSANENIKVIFDGQELIFDTHPRMFDDRVIVPMRKIFEELGATVEWDSDTNTVTATKETDIIKLTIGSDIMLKNDEETELAVPARIIDDRTFVPIRTISEGLNYIVQWDSYDQAVRIFTRTTIQGVTFEDEEQVIVSLEDTIHGVSFVKKTAQSFDDITKDANILPVDHVYHYTYGGFYALAYDVLRDDATNTISFKANFDLYDEGEIDNRRYVIDEDTVYISSAVDSKNSSKSDLENFVNGTKPYIEIHYFYTHRENTPNVCGSGVYVAGVGDILEKIMTH